MSWVVQIFVSNVFFIGWYCSWKAALHPILDVKHASYFSNETLAPMLP